MKRCVALKHKFVEYIPDDLEDRTIYISIDYATAVHKCCCGCDHEVVTPFSQTDWQLIFDGQSISLYPSIGNWNFACQSHYWIERNKIKWAPRWSKEKINTEITHDILMKERYFYRTRMPTANATIDILKESKKDGFKKNIWLKLKNWFH